jgi:hypothetical protein
LNNAGQVAFSYSLANGDQGIAVATPVTVASLTWNNTGGASPSDGKTWDTTNNNWNNGSAVTVYTDGSNVTFNDSNNGHYAVTLNTAVKPASMTVNSSGNYTISGTGSIAGSGSLSKSGTGKLTISTSGSLFGAVNITGGTVQLGTSTGLASLTSLSISGNGAFDVNNNHLIINYGSGPDPIASIAALLATGYAGGAWNGPGGIVSSAVASNPGYGVGYADAADTGNPAALASGTIEVKFTLLGDADLNGTVNGIDFGILAANFNKGVSRWDQGDFNYDNIVNGVDFGALAANFNKGASGAAVGLSALSDPAIVAFAQANGLMADVPEPVGAGVLALFGALAMRRRTR